VLLLIFAFFDIRLLKRLPWIKTEKSTALNGFPNMLVARVCLFGRVTVQTLQLWASLLDDASDNLYISLSVLLLMHSLISAGAFLQLTQADEAKLAIVSVGDLLKIEDFNSHGGSGHGGPRGSNWHGGTEDEEAMMSLEAVRMTIATEEILHADCNLYPDLEEATVETEVCINSNSAGKDQQKNTKTVAKSSKSKTRSSGDFSSAGIEMGEVGGRFVTSVEHADKNQEMLLQQLKDAGKVAIVYIPLDKLNAEIGILMAALNAGEPYDEARLDYLLLCLDANPEYKAQKAKELEEWKKSVAAFMRECLKEMRTFISAQIFRHSVASLQQESGYSIGLCKRLLSKKCLWLTRISTEDICRMHHADLVNKFNPLSQGLDIVELAAIYAQMPEKFLVDPGGKKEAYREALMSSLKGMMSKQSEGSLSKTQMRNPLYSAAAPSYEQRATLHSLNSRNSFQSDDEVLLRARTNSSTSSRGDNTDGFRAAGGHSRSGSDLGLGIGGDELPPTVGSPNPLLNSIASMRSRASSSSSSTVSSHQITQSKRPTDIGGAGVAIATGSRKPPPAFANSLDALIKKRRSASVESLGSADL